MADTGPRVVVIAPESINSFLRKRYDDWNFFRRYDGPEEFLQALKTDSELKKTKVVFIIDHFYEKNKSSFSKIVAHLSPHIPFFVLSYGGKKIEEKITSDVERILKYQNSRTKGAGLASDNLTFVPQNSDIHAIISDAIDDFVERKNDPKISKLFNREFTEEEMEFSDLEDEGLDTDDDNLPHGNGFTLCFTSSKGGSGKSTTAVLTGTYIARASEMAVAQGLEERPLRVAIIDGDIKDAQIASILRQVGNNEKITSMIRGLTPVTRKNVAEIAIKDESVSRCDLFLGPSNVIDGSKITHEYFNKFIATVKTMYDIVIIDTNVNYTEPINSKSIYPSSDRIMFVTDYSPQSKVSMAKWIKYFRAKEREGESVVDFNNFAIILNKAIPSDDSKQKMPLKTILGKVLGGHDVTMWAIVSSVKAITEMGNLNTLHRAFAIEPRIRMNYSEIARAIVATMPPIDGSKEKYRLSKALFKEELERLRRIEGN